MLHGCLTWGSMWKGYTRVTKEDTLALPLGGQEPACYATGKQDTCGEKRTSPGLLLQFFSGYSSRVGRGGAEKAT